MTFSALDILNEFIEAASIVDCQSTTRESWLWRKHLRNRERAAEWYALPWNHKSKNAYMREYNKLPHVVERRRLHGMTPEAKAIRSMRNKRWYEKAKNTEAFKARRKLKTQNSEYRRREKLRQLARVTAGYFTMASRRARVDELSKVIRSTDGVRPDKES